jgi:ribosomal protein S27E
MTFKFAAARAQVCKYCKFVVARTAGGLQATGRMAELLEIQTPLQLHATGRWGGEQFEVEGRIQMDRAGAPGAPWQEILVYFPMSGRHTWVAYAQGRWYATTETDATGVQLPAVDSLGPGSQVNLGPHGVWVVQEVGQRRVVSGEGEMSNVPAPGVITRYADISAQGGAFGTIDYGDGSAAPTLFLGRQFQPTDLQLDSGMALDEPQTEVQALECPNCGGNLPILSQRSERVVCKYCGTASDIGQGSLSALGPAPPPPIQPYIPIGAEGELRGQKMTCVGFVVRSCMVEGVVYSWREYLLFGGDSFGYQWLMEEDGNWTLVQPVETGDVMDSGNTATFNGQTYTFKQQVNAKVDFVIGEFYWKVEIGEQVEATEFEGPGGKLSREKSATEVNYSFVSPLNPSELAAFGVSPPAGAAMAGTGGGSGGGCSSSAITVIIILIICFVLAMAMGGACGGGGGSYSGGSSWSK